MKEIQIERKTLKGFKTRTTNQNEMKPETAKIGALWQSFDQKVAVDYQNGDRIYGVYYDYESDANGEFSVLAGFDGAVDADSNLDEVSIEAGKYLRFDGTAKTADDAARVQAIIETWGEIWQYFSAEPEYERDYKTDFEYYKDPTQIEIYISIK